MIKGHLSAVLLFLSAVKANAFQTIAGRAIASSPHPFVKRDIHQKINISDKTQLNSHVEIPVKSDEKNEVNEYNHDIQVSFSHVHLYVDKLEDIEVYKQIENKLNAFAAQASKESDIYVDGKFELQSAAKIWKSVQGDNEICGDSSFLSHGRDVVKQLLSGLGYRVTGMLYPSSDNCVTTRNLVVASRDPKGVQVVVSAIDESQSNNISQLERVENFLHFDAGKMKLAR